MHSNVFRYYITYRIFNLKKRIYRFDRKKRISDSDCAAKNTQYKRKNALFYMTLKENIT